MNRKEALEKWLPIISMGVKDIPECKEALNMAIKALEQEPTTKNDLLVDCISRQSVLNYIDYIQNHGMGKKKSFDFINKFVVKLPPATPQEPTTKNYLGVDCIPRKVMCDLGATCIAYRNDKQELIPIISIDELPSVTPQEPTIDHCKDCKYFEYDSVAKVDGIPLIVAHEICKRWGDGCKTKEGGYCFLFESQESEE